MKSQSRYTNRINQNLRKKVKFKSVVALQKAFPTERKCIKYLERIIWKGIIISPFDPTSKVYFCPSVNKYKCNNTGKYFTVKTGTVFDNTKLPLWIWFWALTIFSAHKKGNPSHQLARDAGITQKSAWFLLQRLRCAFDCPKFKTILKGFVEADETFLGGSNLNRHWNKKAPKTQGRNWKDKIPVLGIIEKNGNLICWVVPDTKKNTLEPIIRKYIKEGSNVFTDEWLAYNGLDKWFNHEIVNHRKKQYVNGKATTNRIENVWSHLKRLINTYHWISRKHAQKYVDEFTFRYNTRNYSEQERFDLLLSSAIGKKMTYRELIAS